MSSSSYPPKRARQGEADPPPAESESGRARKSARNDGKEDGAEPQPTAKGGRQPRQLRVKLTGAGNCTRQMQDSPGGGAGDGGGATAPSTAASSGEALASDDVSAGGAGGVAAAGEGNAAPAGGKFEVGDTVILFNGSLCYEAEVLQSQLSEWPPSKKRTIGQRKDDEKAAGGPPVISYLIRYTR